MEGNIIDPFRVGTNDVALPHVQFDEDSFVILNHMVGCFEAR